MIPTLLVTGRDGQLGFELRRTLAPLGRVVAVSRNDVDLADVPAVRQLVRDVRPDIIVSAAAYTAVDRAEKECELANIVNGQVPGVLGEELKRVGGQAVIHYSTDYVFDGRSTQPYLEDDAISPVNAYGESKLAGECALQQSGVPFMTLRTQWLYATRGANFLLTMLRLAKQGRPLRVVADQWGAPTWVRMLAEASAQAVARFLGSSDAQRQSLSGVYHLTATGQTTWHGFTQAIFEESLARQKALNMPLDWCESALAALTPITTAEYPTPARRPAYSVLSNDKIGRVFGIQLPEWRQQLQMALEDCSTL